MSRWTRWAGAALLTIAALAFTAATSAAEGEANCSVAANPVACENALPGAPPSEWQVKEVGDPSIQGFATSMSVDAGETERFKVKTDAGAYHLDIYRLGWYGGDGARLIAAGIEPTAALPQVQPECLHEASTGLIDCGNWGESAQWTVPSTAVSGVYVALLTREDTGGKSQIVFVVRNEASRSKLLVQTSDATWQAYNAYGGNSLYTCTVACPPGNPKEYKGAYSVSYNRPFDGSFATDGGASYLFYAEYQLIRFLERNGYDVSYIAGADVDHGASQLEKHQVFISSGHDEYWSAGQRASVEAAREAGVDLAFFSANEIFWKTRWGDSTEGAETPYRTLTTYKETHFDGPVDPQDKGASPVWTGAWRDPRASPPGDGGKPENALSGQQFEVNSGTAEITVPAQYSKLRLWRNTAVANLHPGQTLTLAPGVGTLGYEWDEDVDNGFRPAGEFDLSQTTVENLQSFTDYGSTLTENNSVGTHHLTLYRAPSGALVFGAGTVQWSWGLDNTNAWDAETTDPNGVRPDPNMQQATVNLLAEMGAEPETLMAGLVDPSKSADTTPPSSTISSPQAGETVKDGSNVTVSGTATDSGGGVVAGVEVSTDGGSSWHPATLTSGAGETVAWTYAWVAHGNPSTTIRSRAVDDSANLETPGPGVSVAVACPCSLWGAGVTPPQPDSGDENSVELGVKFTSQAFGQVTGVRFFKSSENTGTHTGSLWSASGELLATATFVGETASGWQQVNFSKPVDVFPGQTYVASYFAPNGHYAASNYYFYTPPPTAGNILDSPPLSAVSAAAPPSDGAYGSANGLFSYSPTSTFPTTSFAGTNYWVDPVFVPGPAPGQVGEASASPNPGSADVTWSEPASGGPVTEYTITPYIGSSPQTPVTVTGTPPLTEKTIAGLSNGTSYTFTVTAANPAGAGPPSAHTAPVTPSETTPPSAPTSVSARGATEQALVSFSPPVSSGGSEITGYTVTPYREGVAQPSVQAAAGASSALVTGLTDAVPYTFRVSASNALGEGPRSPATSAVSPRHTIFDFTPPVTVDSGDTNSTELGVKFSSETPGTVVGIRFYKAAANTGTHVGSLWTAGGTLLATATFEAESPSGWQQASFAKPVHIAAGTVYVAGYFAPHGHYSATANGLSTATENTPLTALGNGSSPDGVFSYTLSPVFPASSFHATSYSVDVAFEPAPLAPGAVSAAGAVNGTATVSWSPPAANGSSPVSSYTVTPYAGAVAGPDTTVKAPLTQAAIAGLNNGTAYTFTVAASNQGGEGTPSAHSAPITPKAAHLTDLVRSADGTAKVTTAKFTTERGGERLLALVSAAAPSGGKVAAATAKVSGAGLAWTLVKRSSTSAGDVEIWTAGASKLLKNKSVSASVKPKGLALSLTVVALKLSKGAGASGAASGSGSAPSLQLASSEEGTTMFAAGIDPDQATAPALLGGETLVHQDLESAAHRTMWVAQLEQPLGAAGTVVTLGASAPGADRWDMAAVEALGP